MICLSRMSCPIASVVSMLLAVAAYADDQPATLPAIETIAQLERGKAEGTMRLIYHGRAHLGLAGHCALKAVVRDPSSREVVFQAMEDAKDFTLEKDLAPGTYQIAVAPAKGEQADYWPSFWQRFHIDKFGRLYEPHEWSSTPGTFVLEARMKGLSPAEMAVASEPAPLLLWPRIPGATHYVGSYRTGAAMKWFNVDEPQLRIGAGVSAGQWCMWRVVAMDKHDNPLARGQGSFLGNGTDEVKAKQLLTDRGSCRVVNPPAAPSWLGVRLSPAQTPKSPALAMEYGRGGSYIVQSAESGYIAGIRVEEVIPGSPAVEADLHPDDVIIAIDGQPVAAESNEGDVRAFQRKIAAMAPGTPIAITVRRFPRELILHSTIGRSPGARNLPAGPPASQAVDGKPRHGDASR